MKKINAAVNENDRIIIDIVTRQKIQYLLVEARTGRTVPLGGTIDFSLSVKKYFGVWGKTIKELYAFNAWHNRKLQKEMERIWHRIDMQFRERRERKEKAEKRSVIATYGSCDEERVA